MTKAQIEQVIKKVKFQLYNLYENAINKLSLLLPQIVQQPLKLQNAFSIRLIQLIQLISGGIRSFNNSHKKLYIL